MKNTKNCPECGSLSTIPYIYGLMSEDAHKERSKKGEYIWGGCVMYRDRPSHFCKDCEEPFGTKPIKTKTSKSGGIFRDII